MAKYELVKETRPSGSILYSVELDGKYVSYTSTTLLEQAEEFLRLLANGVNNPTTLKETIKTIEVND